MITWHTQMPGPITQNRQRNNMFALWERVVDETMGWCLHYRTGAMYVARVQRRTEQRHSYRAGIVELASTLADVSRDTVLRRDVATMLIAMGELDSVDALLSNTETEAAEAKLATKKYPPRAKFKQWEARFRHSTPTPLKRGHKFATIYEMKARQPEPTRIIERYKNLKEAIADAELINTMKDTWCIVIDYAGESDDVAIGYRDTHTLWAAKRPKNSIAQWPFA
jgi:hypothetical protein